MVAINQFIKQGGIMTDNQEKVCRAAFEKYAEENLIGSGVTLIVSKINGKYVWQRIDQAWQIWQAAWSTHTKEMVGKELREKLIEAIGLYQGWEESAVKMVDECILPILSNSHVQNTPKNEHSSKECSNSEHGELVKEIDAFIKSDSVSYTNDEWGNVESCITLKDAKLLLGKCKQALSSSFSGELPENLFDADRGEIENQIDWLMTKEIDTAEEFAAIMLVCEMASRYLNLSSSDPIKTIPKRIEIINHSYDPIPFGRLPVDRVDISYQDEGKTLKIFLKDFKE